jgi:hypothetical protein
MKKYVALLGAGMFCVVCLSMYMMLESTQWQPKMGDMDQVSWILCFLSSGLSLGLVFWLTFHKNAFS